MRTNIHPPISEKTYEVLSHEMKRLATQANPLWLTAPAQMLGRMEFCLGATEPKSGKDAKEVVPDMLNRPFFPFFSLGIIFSSFSLPSRTVVSPSSFFLPLYSIPLSLSPSPIVECEFNG